MTDEIIVVGCLALFCAQLAGPASFHPDALATPQNAYVKEIDIGKMPAHLPDMYEAD